MRSDLRMDIGRGSLGRARISNNAGYTLLEMTLVALAIGLLVFGGIQVVETMRLNNAADRTVRAMVALEEAFYAWQVDNPFNNLSEQGQLDGMYIDTSVFSAYIPGLLVGSQNTLVNGEGNAVRCRLVFGNPRVSVIDTVVGSESHALKVADRIGAVVTPTADEKWLISSGLPESGLLSLLQETMMLDARADTSLRRPLQFNPESPAIVTLGEPCTGCALAVDAEGRAVTCPGRLGGGVWSLVDCNRDCKYGHTPTGDCDDCVCNLDCGENFRGERTTCVCVCDLLCSGKNLPNELCTECICDLDCTEEGKEPNSYCTECVCEDGLYLTDEGACEVCTLDDSTCTGNLTINPNTCECACNLECGVGYVLDQDQCTCQPDCDKLRGTVERNGVCVCDSADKVMIEDVGCFTQSELIGTDCTVHSDDVARSFLNFTEEDQLVYFYDEYACNAQFGCNCTTVMCLSKVLVDALPQCFTNEVRHPDNICYDCLSSELGFTVARTSRYANNRAPASVPGTVCYDADNPPRAADEPYGAADGACSTSR